MKKEIKVHGFAPVYDENSRVLILGSFPSVKSREISFYYGNKQNRFWKTVCPLFGENIPDTVAGKTEFLHRRKIALWDVVVECDVVGSSDTKISNAVVCDLAPVLKNAPIEKILLNGTTAFTLFVENYGQCGVPFVKMPSTSPANPRFDETVWKNELDFLL